jgi:hypothetical protein
VEKVEQGKYTSLAKAGRKNGIRGSETLVTWIKQYEREDILAKRLKVETVKEADELKSALANAHRDWCLEKAFFDMVCERLGTTAEELKKQRRNACGRAKEQGDAGPVKALCERLGMTRQNYY